MTVREDTIGVHSSGRAGHPNHPWLAKRSRLCNPPPGRMDFQLRASSRWVRDCVQDGRHAVPWLVQPAWKPGGRHL